MRALVLALPLVASGCAGVAFRAQRSPTAFVYADASVPLMATANPLAKKKGEACATSILGWVTTGDASIRAAADAGGIEAISAVDSTFTNVLGLFAKYCTVVTGGEASATAAEGDRPAEPAETTPAEGEAPKGDGAEGDAPKGDGAEGTRPADPKPAPQE
jgi:hypothetical protein